MVYKAKQYVWKFSFAPTSKIYILLDVSLCSILPCGLVKIQTTSKNSQRYYTTVRTSNKNNATNKFGTSTDAVTCLQKNVVSYHNTWHHTYLDRQRRNHNTGSLVYSILNEHQPNPAHLNMQYYIPHKWIVPFARSDWLTWRWLASTIYLRATGARDFQLFRPLFLHKKTFWSANYSACVVYTKTIIHLSVGESDGYLPSRFAAR